MVIHVALHKGYRQVWLIPTADERVGMKVKLWDPHRCCTIHECFWGDDSRRGAMSSVYVP